MCEIRCENYDQLHLSSLHLSLNYNNQDIVCIGVKIQKILV